MPPGFSLDSSILPSPSASLSAPLLNKHEPDSCSQASPKHMYRSFTGKKDSTRAIQVLSSPPQDPGSSPSCTAAPRHAALFGLLLMQGRGLVRSAQQKVHE